MTRFISKISSLVMVIFFIFLFMGNAWAQEEEGKIGCFAVTAYNNYGESGYSEIVCSPRIFPGNTVTLAWNAVIDATGYKLYYRKDTESDWKAPIDVLNKLTCPVPAGIIFVPGCTDNVTISVID